MGVGKSMVAYGMVAYTNFKLLDIVSKILPPVESGFYTFRLTSECDPPLSVSVYSHPCLLWIIEARSVLLLKNGQNYFVVIILTARFV